MNYFRVFIANGNKYQYIQIAWPEFVLIDTSFSTNLRKVNCSLSSLHGAESQEKQVLSRNFLWALVQLNDKDTRSA